MPLILIFILFVLTMLRDHHYLLALVGTGTLIWVSCGTFWRSGI